MERPRALTAREIARVVGGELEGPAEIRLAGVAPLDRARPGELSFLASKRYLPQFEATGAGAVLLHPEYRHLRGGPSTRILVDDTRSALQRVVMEIYPPEAPSWGIHPLATIGKRARWTGRVRIGAHSILQDEVLLGEDCIIGSGVVIGARTRIGSYSQIDAGTTIDPDTVIGNRVLIRSGARIGGTGFGYVVLGGQSYRRTHLGGCVIGDGVEIGANSTIDRGSMGDTSIGSETKIDNLVHVAHNVRIGRRCLIMAQVGIAGSTEVGDDVALGGQAGLADHLSVGSGSRIAAQSGVIGDLPPQSAVSGYPARSHRELLRQVAALKRLTPLVKRLEQVGSGSDER